MKDNEKLQALTDSNENETKSKGNYLTGKEIRKIAKENKKVMKRLEAYKYRRAPESEYTTQMKDEQNILEIEGDELQISMLNKGEVVVSGIVHLVKLGENNDKKR